MKLILRTNTPNTYFVYLPNYIDANQETIDCTLLEAKWSLPEGVEITSHYLNSDGLTDEERKQMDIYGEIKYPLIPIAASTVFK